MTYVSFLAAYSLPGLVLAGGLLALLRRRRRAPRAVGFAVPLVLLLAVSTAYVPLRLITGLSPPPVVAGTVRWAQLAIACIVLALLPVAAMIDRRPGGRHDG